MAFMLSSTDVGEESANVNSEAGALPETVAEAADNAGLNSLRFDLQFFSEESTPSVDNPLPYFKNAVIDSKKIYDYALNPNHPVGGNKARVFGSALGYNQSNGEGLIAQIYENLPQNEAITGQNDQFGQRYTVDMSITGPNGNTAVVRTGCILAPGSVTPSLTTLFVK